MQTKIKQNAFVSRFVLIFRIFQNENKTDESQMFTRQKI